ncbi:MAG TPA: hypothetical protein VMX17_08445 [Candidatus Glassbacteria bacterium]|nr:hypothetical protein [Candidatus Glassbacteria bacterium]
MKICWDNLEKLKYTKYGFMLKGKTGRIYYYIESENPCLNCGEEFLTHKNQKFNFCSRKCSQSGKYNNYYGKKRPNHSKKMRENNPMEFIHNFGKDNPNWKGGITQNKYCSGWTLLSEEIRDYYKTCQNPNCCRASNIMTTHHIDYDKENCRPDNLICLCNICNGKANGKREYHKEYYRRLKENEQNYCA